jgi:hypothetical protein
MSAVDDLALGRLAFLLGRWIGARSGETVEEVWTRVGADAMMGMFCWSRADGSRIFEFLILEEKATGIAMTMQVHPPRGRPAHWHVVRTGDDEVVFEGRDVAGVARMLYRRERADRLYVVLERVEDGRTQIFPWHYEAAPLTAAAAR